MDFNGFLIDFWWILVDFVRWRLPVGAGGSIADGGGDPTPTQFGPWPSPGWQFGVCVCCVGVGSPHWGGVCVSTLAPCHPGCACVWAGVGEFR